MIKIHKKTFAVLVGFAIALLPFLALAFSVTPSSGLGSTVIDCSIGADSFGVFYQDANVGTGSCPSTFSDNVNGNNPADGVYTLIECDNASPDVDLCLNAVDISTALASAAFVSQGTFTVGAPPAPVLSTIFPAFTGQIGEEIQTGLTPILVILAGLIGLGILCAYVYSMIGKSGSNSIDYGGEKMQHMVDTIKPNVGTGYTWDSDGKHTRGYWKN